MRTLLALLLLPAAAAAAPPPTRKEAVTDTFHGVRVADPYRWLEDGKAGEVVRWTAAQNAWTRTALDALRDPAEPPRCGSLSASPEGGA